MKTYEQWSSRMKQVGKPADQYSQAAYQGYVNNMNQPKQQSEPSNPAPRPLPAPPPLQQSPQIEQLSGAVESLQSQIQQQANDYDARIAKMQANKPGDASKALNSTILTSPFGDQNKKKQKSFLTPFGG
jgi:hypothetical protein